VQIQVKPLEEKGEKPLRVSQAPAWQANGHAKDAFFEGQYRKAKAKGECPNTKAAVLIDGKSAGSIFYLCQTEKSKLSEGRRHLPSASRSSRACASSKAFARSCRTLFPGLTWKW